MIIMAQLKLSTCRDAAKLPPFLAGSAGDHDDMEFSK
jgi:hypothetical protein